MNYTPGPGACLSLYYLWIVLLLPQQSLLYISPILAYYYTTMLYGPLLPPPGPGACLVLCCYYHFHYQILSIIYQYCPSLSINHILSITIAYYSIIILLGLELAWREL